MELRQYWNVISKRRWLVLAIIALAGLFSAYSYLTTPKAYNADAKFAVRQAQSQRTVPVAFFTFNDYYNWIASE